MPAPNLFSETHEGDLVALSALDRLVYFSASQLRSMSLARMPLETIRAHMDRLVLWGWASETGEYREPCWRITDEGAHALALARQFREWEDQ